jgi:hypothetical protein
MHNWCLNGAHLVPTRCTLDALMVLPFCCECVHLTIHICETYHRLLAVKIQINLVKLILGTYKC